MDFIRNILGYFNGKKAHKRKKNKPDTELHKSSKSKKKNRLPHIPEVSPKRSKSKKRKHNTESPEQSPTHSKSEKRNSDLPSHESPKRTKSKKRQRMSESSDHVERYTAVYNAQGDLLHYIKSDEEAQNTNKVLDTISQEASDPEKTEWNWWPNGTFELDFTHEEYEKASQLKVHWATRSWGGNKTGRKDASDWERGKLVHRRCQGIVRCGNPSCKMIIRPQSTVTRVEEQLHHFCACGEQLEHLVCHARDSKYEWSGGIHYIHTGIHTHPPPTHVLHATKDEMQRFRALVINNPTTKALALIVGAPPLVPGVTEARPSVANISSIFSNSHRVANERAKIIKPPSTQGASEFLDHFSAFLARNPDWMIYSYIGKGVMVFVFQSEFMRSQLVGTDVPGKPVNGLVNDAAHGWWKNRSHLLMMSSTYSSHLGCWVPGVMTFTNGATEQHFQHHFIGLFISIEAEAKIQNVLLTDRLFSGIMDFSEAEKNGFMLAFVDFWTHYAAKTSPLTKRSQLQLTDASEALLKGCRQHFKANARRISKITAIVDPEHVEHFLNRIFGLLDAKSIEEFEDRCNDLLKLYPDIEPWLNWYRRPAHARMLFESARQMDIDIWDSLPDTTNAEEAMHWKFYAACGKDHSFMDGMENLLCVSEYYERANKDVLAGIRREYGEGQISQVIAEVTGSSKPRRRQNYLARQSKSDSRGPDTIKKLAKANKGLKRARAHEDALVAKIARMSRDKKSRNASIAKRRNTIVKKKATSSRKKVAFNTPSSPVAVKKPKLSGLGKVKALPIGEKKIKDELYENENPPIFSSVLSYPAIVKKPKRSGLEKAKALPVGEKKIEDKLYENPPVFSLSLSYPWFKNSCWLDTSLHLLYVIFGNPSAFPDLQFLCEQLPITSGVLQIFTALDARNSLPDSLTNTKRTKELARQRDALRSELSRRRIVDKNHKYEPLMTWIYKLIHYDSNNAATRTKETYRAAAFFQILVLDIHLCSGCNKIGGRHVEISKTPNRRQVIDLTEHDHAAFNGKFADFAQSFFTVYKPLETANGCWRVDSALAQRICTGERQDYRNIVASVPVMLTVEVETTASSWDFPAVVTPDPMLPNVAYNLAGLGLFSANKRHFSCRYISTSNDGFTEIHTYDGMAKLGRFAGFPQIEQNAEPCTHFHGADIQLAPGWRVSHAVYYLQGGKGAQDEFFEHRLNEITTTYSLSFPVRSLSCDMPVLLDDDTLTLLPGWKRHWLSRPDDKNTAEYIGIHAPIPSPQRLHTGTEPAATNTQISITAPLSEFPMDIMQSPPTPQYKDVFGSSPTSTSDSSSLSHSIKLLRKNKKTSSPSLRASPPHITSPAPVASSSPAPVYTLNCRCGAVNDAVLNSFGTEHGEVVQCNVCMDWSHIACQREGRADRIKGPFICDGCGATEHQRTKPISRRQLTRSFMKVPLSQRLCIGRAALARNGDFWYPVRLIDRQEVATWKVKWWRGCTFSSILTEPGTTTTVAEDCLVDSLFGYHHERRQIRLGKWAHAVNTPTIEDIADDPNATPYTTAVDSALAPSIHLLKELLFAPEVVNSAEVPAKEWLETHKKRLTDIIPFTGSLTFTEIGEISNWFEDRVAEKDSQIRHLWSTGLPIAHARTLYIVSRDNQLPVDNKKIPSAKQLRAAWSSLSMGSYPIAAADVDREAIMLLEELMFERSLAAGVAGYHQWGLDVGDHQDCWNPYGGLPSHWNHDDRVDSESELEPGPNFIVVECPKTPVHTSQRPRPKPRPVKIPILSIPEDSCR